MLEAAAFWASRITRSMAGLLVTMSLKVTAPPLRAERFASTSSASTFSALAIAVLQPLRRGRLDDEIEGAVAHRRDHGFDAALRGLDDHRDRDAALAHRLQHADAVEAGHGEVEHDGRDIAAGRGFERGQCRLAAIGDHRLVAEFRHGGLEQPALHGIVIDYEDGTCHEDSVIEPR